MMRSRDAAQLWAVATRCCRQPRRGLAVLLLVEIIRRMAWVAKTVGGIKLQPNEALVNVRGLADTLGVGSYKTWRVTVDELRRGGAIETRTVPTTDVAGLFGGGAQQVAGTGRSKWKAGKVREITVIRLLDVEIQDPWGAGKRQDKKAEGAANLGAGALNGKTSLRESTDRCTYSRRRERRTDAPRNERRHRNDPAEFSEFDRIASTVPVPSGLRGGKT